MKINFEGYILAGGKSSRMGRDKLALKIGHETFLEHSLKIVSPICAMPVIIVLNQSQNVKTDQPVIRDLFPERGAPGGLHAAFSECRAEFAIILAVDLPLVTTETIEKLAGIALFSKNKDAVIPLQPDGRPQPLCAIYRVKKCLPVLEKLLEEKISASVRDFLELINPEYIKADKLGPEKNLFLNINYPDDLRQIVEN